MRYLAVFALGVALALVGSVAAIETQPQADGSVFIKLSPAEAASCASEGGCAIVTKRGLSEAIRDYCGASI